MVRYSTPFRSDIPPLLPPSPYIFFFSPLTTTLLLPSLPFPPVDSFTLDTLIPFDLPIYLFIFHPSRSNCIDLPLTSHFTSLTRSYLFIHYVFMFLLHLFLFSSPFSNILIPIPSHSYHLRPLHTLYPFPHTHFFPYSPTSLSTTTLSSCTLSPFYPPSILLLSRLTLTIHFTSQSQKILSLHLFFIFFPLPLFLFPSPFSNISIYILSSTYHP